MSKTDPVDKLTEAYSKMLERTVDAFHKAEEKSASVFHRVIDEAREKAVEMGELSREEADKVAEYLRRDIHDAAAYMEKTGEEFKAWLGFETDLIDAELYNLFVQVADPTVLELLELKAQASIYRTGEVAGPGTLICEQCGEKLHFSKPGKIPPCPKCHGSIFHREG
ncbi:MAG TPA: hypothetical protein EYH03_03700 [Chromatiales bacterium]|nr:hypothetical protein [Chromatiales bacterium]